MPKPPTSEQVNRFNTARPYRVEYAEMITSGGESVAVAITINLPPSWVMDDPEVARLVARIAASVTRLRERCSEIPQELAEGKARAAAS